MDKSSNFLENLAAPQPQLLIGYQKLYSDPLLVGQEINLGSSIFHHTLPERDSLVSIPKQPLVKKSVDLAPP